MIDFTKKMKTMESKTIEDPIKIYDSLDRTSTTGPLRPSQEMVLSKWYKEKLNAHDVIIKLHTGEGKTLIGLLILQTKLNRKEGPCIYVCPNKYLVEQVYQEAVKFGIQVCTIGETNFLPYEFINEERILITHVQKLFNGKTIFGLGNSSEEIGTIVLDDAHACLDSIREAFIIKINRNDNRELFDQFLDLFEPDLVSQGEGTFSNIKNNVDYENLMAIPYWAWIEKKSQVLRILASKLSDSNISFVWPLIKDSLETCHAFVNSRELQIMPIVPPIHMFGSFENAKNRILMSATTQDDSFFVKLLGISVDAIRNPILNENQLWSGEKMILIPEMVSNDFTRNEMIDYFGNLTFKFGAVALTPNWKKQEDYRKLGCVLLDKNNIRNEISNLQKGEFGNGKLRVLANRYDGIDLPDRACRFLILDSMPYFANMEDRYEQMVRRNSDLIKRKIAQRIEQGLGRSVRGEKDYSVIIIIGSDLVRFIRNNANRKLFSVQTQKQIELGFQVAAMEREAEQKVSISDLVSVVNQCLKRDSGWKDFYVQSMNEILKLDVSRETELSILSLEAQAEKMFLQRKYDEAAKEIQKILDGNYINEEGDRGWYLQMKALYEYYISKVDSQKLQRAAFNKNFEVLKPQEGVAYKSLQSINVNRMENISSWIARFRNFDELMMKVNSICADFSFGVGAAEFEKAVQGIGEMLGYESQRPDKTIRKGPDNLWAAGNNSYIMIECKSEVSQGRKNIYKSEVGQMNNHCGWFESEYHDAKVFRVMIIPTRKVAYDADFTHLVYVMRKDNLNLLKTNIQNFFQEFRNCKLDSITEDFVNERIQMHNLTDEKMLRGYVEETQKEKN